MGRGVQARPLRKAGESGKSGAAAVRGKLFHDLEKKAEHCDKDSREKGENIEVLAVSQGSKGSSSPARVAHKTPPPHPHTFFLNF